MTESQIDRVGRRIESQTRALVARRFESDRPADAIPARTRHRTSHYNWPAELFFPSRHIQSMQRKRPTGGLRQHVHGSCSDVDHGSAGDSQLRRDPFHIVLRNGYSQIDAPQRCALRTARVKSKNGIGFGRDKDDVVFDAADAELRQIQRLCVYLAIDRVGKQFPKQRRIHIQWRQRRLSRERTIARIVIVIAKHRPRTAVDHRNRTLCNHCRVRREAGCNAVGACSEWRGVKTICGNRPYL